MSVIRGRLWVRMAACLGSLALVACGSRIPDTQPRLVIVYATCSLHKNYIAPYDPSVMTTPHLAEFAREALVFERHHTESGSSGVAFASILTGGQAPHHRVFYHPSRIAPEVRTLSEVFADAGYETYFWDSHEMAPYHLDYGQGVPEDRVFKTVLSGNSREFRGLLKRLVDDPDLKAFILQTNAIPHSPYAGPEAVLEFAARFPAQTGELVPAEVRRLLTLHGENEIALKYNFDATVRELGLTETDVEKMSAFIDVAYRTRVYQLDAVFGSVWQTVVEAGLADQSLIAFTSDHGEVLTRDNLLFRWAHGLQLPHEVLNVPLIIRSGRPRIAPGRFEAVTRTIDFMPTLAGLAGISIGEAEGMEGIDLSQAVLGRTEPPALTAFSHTEFNPSDAEAREVVAGTIYAVADLMFPGHTAESVWVSARHGDLWFKLRRMDGKSWRLEAFDLANDPAERHDVFDPENPEHRLVAEQLRAYKKRMVDEFGVWEAERAAELAVEKEERLEALRSLGYIK